MAIEYQTLLYDNTSKLPDEIWSRSDVEMMIQTIDQSKDYLHNIWGDWMKARDKLIVKMLFEHALRPKELLCMRIEDIDLKEKNLRIRGENNKTKKDRVIPISEKIASLLIEYLSFPAYLRKNSSYLFPSFSNEFLSSGRWKHIFREKVLKPLDLWKKPDKPSVCKTRSYTLRHSRASELINKTDLYTVANILGHGDIRSTKTYLHMNKEFFNHIRTAINL